MILIEQQGDLLELQILKVSDINIEDQTLSVATFMGPSEFDAENFGDGKN